MTYIRTTALVSSLCVAALLSAVTLFAQPDQAGTRNGPSAKSSKSQESPENADRPAADPRFQLSLIGSGFGPKMGHVKAAIDNDKTRFTQLESIRRQFWATKPGDAKREVLRKHYAEVLLEKDIQLLYGGVTTGSKGLLPLVYRQALDGGVPEAARQVFNSWVEAIRDHMGIREKQRYQQLENLRAFNLDRFERAFEATRHFEDQYMLLRDWSEYQKAGRTQEFYPTPEAYVIYLQQIDGEPLGQAQAVARYQQLAAMFGEKMLKATADQQRSKQTDAYGLIRGSRMKPMYDFFEQISQGSDAGFIFNQFRMVARSKDRWAEAISDFQEMIELIDAKVALAAAAESREDRNAQLADFVRTLSKAGDRECFLVNAARAKGMEWKVAGKQYEALCEIYGEDVVLRAASKVRAAKPLDPSKPHLDYYIKVPADLTEGEGAKSKNSGVTRDEGIALLLKRERRKTEVHGKLYDNATTTLSKDNMISSAQLPSQYSGGRIVTDSEGVAFSVARAPGASLFGGLFGGGARTNRVVIFTGDPNARPATIQIADIDLSGRAMGMSRDYILVGNPYAMLSNPQTGRGSRLKAGEAYVFDRKTRKLITTVRPPHDSLMPELRFGSAVAAWGDLIAVGATGKRGRSENEGEVNVHDARTGEHRFRITMRPEDRAHQGFGAAIATDGTTLAITAPGVEKISRLNPAVFLHKADNGKFVARLDASGNEIERREFGNSITVSGKLVVVGAPRQKNGGSAFVYDSSTGKLLATLKNTTTYQNTADLGGDTRLRSLITRTDQFDYRFGRAVAASEDTIVIASQRSLHVFDAATFRHLQAIPAGKDINSERIQIHDVAITGSTLFATTHTGDEKNWTHHRIEIE